MGLFGKWSRRDLLKSSGAVAGAAAVPLAVSSGNLNLVVAHTSVPAPAINSVTASGGNLIFSGTNGTPNGPYYVLTSTNVALALPSWTSIATNTFSPTGTFSVTNAIGNGSHFFIIKAQ